MSPNLLPVVAPAAAATSAPTPGTGNTVSARTTDGAAGERPSFGAMVSELASADAPRDGDDADEQGATPAVVTPPGGDARLADSPATVTVVHGELTAAVGELLEGGVEDGSVTAWQPDTLRATASTHDQGQPGVAPKATALAAPRDARAEHMELPVVESASALAPGASSSTPESQGSQEAAQGLDEAIETTPDTAGAGGAQGPPEVGQASGATDAAQGVAMPLPVEAPAPPAPIVSAPAPVQANDLASSHTAVDPMIASLVASVATPGGLAGADGRSRGGVSAGVEARRDQRSLRLPDAPGPVPSASGASDAGAADAESVPVEGLRADLSTLGVEVVDTSQHPPAGPGVGSGVADPSQGGPSEATSSASRLPAVAATVGGLASLPLGEFARSLAMSSYAASGPVETPEATPRWTLGPFEAESPHQQVVRAVRLQWANGVSEARLRLHPEHLGDVTIDLRVEQGRVSASLRLDNPAAAEWIRAQRAELQSSLGAQGLDLGTLDIVVDPDSRRRRSATPDPQPRSRMRRHGSDTPRFEVLA